MKSRSMQEIQILFTGDLHSHFQSFPAMIQNEVHMVGGFSRIRTLILQEQSKGQEILVLDCGDFSMGTLVQTVYESQASELRMLGELGYDMTMIGNHEYDYHTKGLYQMLRVALDSGERLPQIAICNIDWASMMAKGLTKDQQQLRDIYQEYGIKEYHVIYKNNLKIAITGVLGKDARQCAPTCPLDFMDPVTAVQATVQNIKKKVRPDLIICISHSGVTKDIQASEDYRLAKGVPDLDVILSGHTHVTREEAMVLGNTYIISPGEYGKYLGYLHLRRSSGDRWTIQTHELRLVEESIPEEPVSRARIDGFLDAVNENYLARFGYTRDQVLVNNQVDFCQVRDLEERHEDLNLGNLISDAYRYALKHLKNAPPQVVDFALVPGGIVRETYVKGQITVEDVYNSFSLGIGADGTAGYPLIKAYITGAEVKIIAEIDASLSDKMPTARLYMSGLHFVFHPKRLMLNKVSDIYLVSDEGERIEIQNDKLYSLVADYYSAQMIQSVTGISKGILSIVPKDEHGLILQDFKDAIIYDGTQELKAWDAIARYFGSFEDQDQDGVGEVSDYYAVTHNRKVMDQDKRLRKRFENLNRYGTIILAGTTGIVLLCVGILTGLILWIHRKRK